MQTLLPGAGSQVFIKIIPRLLAQPYRVAISNVAIKSIDVVGWPVVTV